MGYNEIPESYPNSIVGRVKDSLFYEPTTVQHFPIGTIYRKDERAFRYAYAGGAVDSDQGCQPYYQQEVAYATVAKSCVKGTSEIVIDVAATDGIAAGGAIAKNYLAGGSMIIFTHGTGSFNRRILANSAVATGGGEMTVKLDYGVGAALTVDVSHAECMASVYMDVRTAASDVKAVVGVPVADHAAGSVYLWVQTWGPIWIAPQGAVGNSTNVGQCVFRHDGSLDIADLVANDALGNHECQSAGWVMKHAKAGTQGAPFMFLQIAF